MTETLAEKPCTTLGTQSGQIDSVRKRAAAAA